MMKAKTWHLPVSGLFKKLCTIIMLLISTGRQKKTVPSQNRGAAPLPPANLALFQFPPMIFSEIESGKSI